MLAKILNGSLSCVRSRATPSRLVYQLATPALILILAAIFGPLLLDEARRSGLQESAFALDLGFASSKPEQDLLEAFRARYAGKFWEFHYEGVPDPGWVPYAVEFPTNLPAGMKLERVMIFYPSFSGGLGLVFSDGKRNLFLLQQPADCPIAFSGLETVSDAVCRYKATRCRIGQYSIMTWISANKRSVILSNLARWEIESTVFSLQYVD
jgi:hypothetical protein